MKEEKTLETERLILRPLTVNDAEEAFKNWTSDDEVSKYVRWSTHKNVEETKEYILLEEKRRKTEECFNWGIVIKDSNELIGAMGAFPSEDGRYEIGYNIAKKHWNNGYTTEAVKEVLKYLATEEKIHKFRCAHAVLNPASGAVMRKAGFKYVKDEVCEKFDKSQKFDSKVYYLDVGENYD